MSGRKQSFICLSSLTNCLHKPLVTPSSGLLSVVMNLFKRVIEKRLRKHLKDKGFLGKYRSGVRKFKSTNYHLFRLSQTVMESFNGGNHVIAAILDIDEASNDVSHNGLRYKIYQLDLPTNLCRWLSDFLVGRIIQVN